MIPPQGQWVQCWAHKDTEQGPERNRREGTETPDEPPTVLSCLYVCLCVFTADTSQVTQILKNASAN